jgi:hypothetical protein
VINQIRRLLYALASILGDINAIKRGKAGKRLLRKVAYRKSGSIVNKLFK